MRSTRVFVAFVTFAGAMIMGFSVAGVRAQIGKPSPGGPQIVQVIGCLEQTSDGAWIVSRAGEPVPSKSTGTSAAGLKEADGQPLGTERFRLIGLSVFTPETQKGHKVEVKGMLIKDSKESRVNVTSLQTANTTCSK